MIKGLSQAIRHRLGRLEQKVDMSSGSSAVIIPEKSKEEQRMREVGLTPEYVAEYLRRNRLKLRRLLRGGDDAREQELLELAGQRVAEIRRRRGLSGTELSRLVGYDYNFVVFLENGLVLREEINKPFLGALSTRLDIDVSLLEEWFDTG